MKSPINLQEITGQESGIILYDDKNVAVVNWSHGEGIPHWLAPLHDPIYMPTEEEIEDCGIAGDILEELPVDMEIIYDRNGDLQDLIDARKIGEPTVGHVYQIGVHYRVIAPEVWA